MTKRDPMNVELAKVYNDEREIREVVLKEPEALDDGTPDGLEAARKELDRKHDPCFAHEHTNTIDEMHESGLGEPVPNETSRDNAGKLEWSYLFEISFAIREVIKVLMMGAKKYARANWMKGGPNTSKLSLMDSCMRHIDARMDGQLRDPESGELHIAMAITNLIFFMFHHDDMFNRRDNIDDGVVKVIRFPGHCNDTRKDDDYRIPGRFYWNAEHQMMEQYKPENEAHAK